MRSDSDPKFVKEFYKALGVVCSDLFMSRYKRSNAMNDALAIHHGKTSNTPTNTTESSSSGSLKEAGQQVLESVFGDAHDETERANVVNDLLDTKLLRAQNNDVVAQDFNRDVMFKRLRKYTDFIVSNKLRSFLGELEGTLTDAKNQGSQSEVDKRLKELNVKVRINIHFYFCFFCVSAGCLDNCSSCGIC